eukprot:11079331-Ditylum_brightwellii.AAC.1
MRRLQNYLSMKTPIQDKLAMEKGISIQRQVKCQKHGAQKLRSWPTESTILDSGTKWPVISGPARSIVKKYNESLSMSAVDRTMKTVSMDLCDDVTAVLNNDKQVGLFGMRKGVYSPMLTDDKAVTNKHFIHEAGWQLSSVAKRHGGSQQVWFPNGDVIPSEYNAMKYKLYVKCCAPTNKELAMVPIHWIDCH